MELEVPKTVRWLTEAVSNQLGRPAFARKVVNREEWYIYDPVFSHVQRVLKQGTGYRVGFRYKLDSHELDFDLTHSPVMCQLLKASLDLPTLLRVAEASFPYRLNRNFLRWSSKYALKESDGLHSIFEFELQEFVQRVQEFDKDHDLIGDLFPRVPKHRKIGRNYAYAGHYFTFAVSERASAVQTKGGVRNVIESGWPLFQCLYPLRPMEKRSAGLLRKMVAGGIPKRCEFKKIQGTENSYILSRCKDGIEAAHIEPHSLGGSDNFENGLWLCQYHHRMTEGHLRGKRTGNEIRVRFVARPRS